MMEVRELRTLKAVAALGSVSKAAQSLSISQPSATRHLASLAESTGLTLVRPGSRPAELTEEGYRLAEMAASLLETIDEIESGGLRSPGLMPVKVVSTQATVSHFLPDVVAEFRLHHQNPVHLNVMTKERALRFVEGRHATIGVVPNPEVPSGLSFEGLFNFRRVLVTPVGHPLTEVDLPSWEDIAHYPLITRPGGAYSRWIIEPELRRYRIPFNVVMEIDNLDNVKEFVRRGVGVAVCPEICVKESASSDICVMDMSHLLSDEQFGLVMIRDRQLSLADRAFADTLRNVGARMR